MDSQQQRQTSDDRLHATDLLTQQQQIFLIGHAHIDPVCLWDYREGIDEAIHTFQSACDILDEYPHVRFSASTASLYREVEEVCPALFQRIGRHIEAGRWEIVGGWWVEADCNLPLEVSLIKQADLGNGYFAHRFGKKSTIAFLPDTFGFPAGLPKVLQQTGFRYLLFSRPSVIENPHVPGDLFYWEHEGARILCYRLREGYNTFPGVEGASQYLESLMADPTRFHHGLAGLCHGIGNHGGGPTRAQIEYFMEQDKTNERFRLTFSTAEEMFARMEQLPEIPVFKGDLHAHAIGCYSIMHPIKVAARRLEKQLQRAERCGISLSAGPAGASGAVKRAWEHLLFNQFHDIICGSCTEKPMADAIAQLSGSHMEVDALIYKQLRRKESPKPDARHRGSFTIHNTLPFAVKAPLICDSNSHPIMAFFKKDHAFCNEDGPLPFQKLIPQSQTGYPERWMWIDELPAAGSRTYSFDLDQRAEAQLFSLLAEATHPGLANERFEVVMNASGLPERVTDKTLGHEVIGPVRLLILDDATDTWSHGEKSYQNVIGEMAPWGRTMHLAGTCADTVMTELRFEDPATRTQARCFCQTTLYAGLPYLELDLRIFWGLRRKILKLEIPFLGGGVDRVLCQGAGGRIERRPEALELPLHDWEAMLGQTQWGIAHSDCFAGDFSDSRARYTLIRSNLHGHDGPIRYPDFEPFMLDTDQGMHRCKFRILTGRPLDLEQVAQESQILYEPFGVVR